MSAPHGRSPWTYFRKRDPRLWQGAKASTFSQRFGLLEQTPALFELPDGLLRALTRRALEVRLPPAEVLLAAGSWSGRLARLLALDLPVQPVKGYTITVRTQAFAPRHPVLLAEGMVAVRPLGDRLRFGGDLSLAGWRPAVSRRRVNRMLATVRAQLPKLEWTDQQVWTGFRPCTPDSLPLLGRAPGYANLTIATGHGHNGMALAPAAGELIARLLTNQELPTDPGGMMDASLFEVHRYATNRLPR